MSIIPGFRFALSRLRLLMLVMNTLTTYNFLALATTLVLNGCFGMADYIEAPKEAVTYGSGNRAIDPDLYRVDLNNFPKYHIKEIFHPPRWKSNGMESRFDMVPILPSDIWSVTHVVNEYYLIYSESYNERQCQYLAKQGPGAGAFISPLTKNCESDYLYHIYITKDGNVSGGWELLKNPKQVIARSERRTFLKPNPHGNEQWGSQPLFYAR